jgi:hypothetical protein
MVGTGTCCRYFACPPSFRQSRSLSTPPIFRPAIFPRHSLHFADVCLTKPIGASKIVMLSSLRIEIAQWVPNQLDSSY